jgi:hypothetical protein
METSSTGSKVQDDQLIIALYIDEGKNNSAILCLEPRSSFCFLGINLNPAEAVIVQASLSNNKLEGVPIKPGHTTSFDCNLIWETDRKSIKR